MLRWALAAACALAVAGAGAGSAGAGGPAGYVVAAPAALELGSADLNQRGPRMVLALRTEGPFGLSDLARFPDRSDPGQAYICMRFRQRKRRQLCLGAPQRRRHVLALSRPDEAAAPARRTLIPARLERASASQVRVSFAMRLAGLRPGRLAWALESHYPGRCGPADPPCDDRIPRGDGWARIRLDDPLPSGCTHRGPPLSTHGPRARKRIAIGFDDGPSDYTRPMLRVLARFNARATFFVVGTELAGGGPVLRRILDSGSEIGNHSFGHESGPSSASLRTTSRRIRGVSGFQPCLFRPPGGGVDSGLVSRARALGMTTVTWDVDPRDWTNPGAAAIASNVIANARAGSIVVMHDGGGSRGQTLEALPRILSHFGRRGFRFVTVTELLGNRFTYRG